MNTIEFDALRWINQYLDYQINMNEDDLKQLEIFTFMWDMFEAKACNGVANAQSITDFVLNKSSFKERGSSVLDAYYDYFSKRYICKGVPNSIFERMTMNATEVFNVMGKEYVLKNFLFEQLSQKSDLEEYKLLTILLVLYRIRGNFFLRDKNIVNVHDQFSNFSVGNNLIAMVLDREKNRR